MWVLGDRTQVLRNSPCKCFACWLTSYSPSESWTILTVGVYEQFPLPQACTGVDPSGCPCVSHFLGSWTGKISLLLFFFFFFFLRQGFSVWLWLSWNSICRPGWPWSQKSACLCLPSTGIKGMDHHCLFFVVVFSFVCVCVCVCVCDFPSSEPMHSPTFCVLF